MRVAGALPSSNAGTDSGFFLRNLVLLVVGRPQGINIATTLNPPFDMHTIRRGVRFQNDPFILNNWRKFQKSKHYA